MKVGHPTKVDSTLVFQLGEQREALAEQGIEVFGIAVPGPCGQDIARIPVKFILGTAEGLVVI